MHGAQPQRLDAAGGAAEGPVQPRRALGLLCMIGMPCLLCMLCCKLWQCRVCCAGAGLLGTTSWAASTTTELQQLAVHPIQTLNAH